MGTTSNRGNRFLDSRDEARNPSRIEMCDGALGTSIRPKPLHDAKGETRSCHTCAMALGTRN